MSAHAILPGAVLAATMAVAGFALGLGYFAALRRTAERLAARDGWRAAVLTLARIAAAVLLLGLAARLGAVALIAAFAGFLIARAVALRVWRRAA